MIQEITDQEWAAYAPLYPYEFDSPDDPGSGKMMRRETMDKLHDARGKAGVPFIINSGVRSKAHNRKVGGKETSSHLGAWAADIACTNSRHRAKILRSVILAGFTRIGIGKTFIHVDCDPSKPAEVYWLY